MLEALHERKGGIIIKQCDQFVTDGHFKHFNSLKAFSKKVVRCDGLLYDLL